ncbi:MAG: aminotransferase class V-fold PLP-dependent enzyme [Actinomycetota bacterium]
MSTALATSLSDAEIAAARQATPGCRADLIHLNHAGASLPPQVVLDAQIDHLRAEAMLGGYEAAAAAAERDDDVYASIAALIGADADEIARTEHATAAWNAAFWSIPMEPGQRVLVHDHEYGANVIAFLRATEVRGVVIDRIPSDGTGAVSIEAYRDALGDGDGVALASLTHVPTNGGLVNPAAEVGAAARAVGVPFLLDACQSVGQLRVDVNEIPCDFLSATGRKFLRGPRGTGFLYARRTILDRVAPSQPDHDGALLVAADRYEWSPGARRFQYWEYSHAAWLGLGAALDHLDRWGVDRIEVTVRERAEELRVLLAGIGYDVHDDGAVRSGIVTTTSPRRSAPELQAHLAGVGINGTYTTSGSSLWDVDRRGLAEMLRLSVHYTTTVDELHRTVDVLAQA